MAEGDAGLRRLEECAVFCAVFRPAATYGWATTMIEDTELLRQLWDKIQYDHRESKLIQFPVFGFDVKEWEEVHKQLLRLFLLTSLQAQKAVRRFKELGIMEQPRLSAVMGDQNLRTLNALQFTKLLEEHAALLAQHRKRLAGLT